MGRRRIWEETRSTIRHIPSGREAYYDAAWDGGIKGWWYDDGFAGTSRREAKSTLKQIFDLLKSMGMK